MSTSGKAFWNKLTHETAPTRLQRSADHMWRGHGIANDKPHVMTLMFGMAYENVKCTAEECANVN